MLTNHSKHCKREGQRQEAFLAPSQPRKLLGAALLGLTRRSRGWARGAGHTQQRMLGRDDCNVHVLLLERVPELAVRSRHLTTRRPKSPLDLHTALAARIIAID